MGDPIRIIENLTQKSILSICFDNDDVHLTISTEDYKIQFYNLLSMLNDDLSLKVDSTKDERIELSMQYVTKKSSILVMRYTVSNILLCLGRFDDNDPKIFM
jgi:hypothetical protein